MPLLLERSDSSANVRRSVDEVIISPGYFRTVGTRLLHGTEFPEGGGGNQLVVSESVAREFWPNEDPVHQMVRIISPAKSGLPEGSRPATVIGVVADVRLPGFGRSARPIIWASMFQNGQYDLTPRLILCGSVNLATLQSTLGKRVQTQLPGMSIQSLYSARTQLKAALIAETQRTYVAMAVTLLMAIVSCISMYAALRYHTSIRRRELAIRVCLGATPAVIRRIIYRKAASWAFVAILLNSLLWPWLAHLSNHEYLGPASWSATRALAICVGCLLLSVLIALVPADAAARAAPAEMLKAD